MKRKLSYQMGEYILLKIKIIFERVDYNTRKHRIFLKVFDALHLKRVFENIIKNIMAKIRKTKSYSDYTLGDLRHLCHIDNRKTPFGLLKKQIAPSEWLIQTLQRNRTQPINTEKARSELLIMPVIIEWLTNNPMRLQCFSGNTFDVDASKALKGRCDAISYLQSIFRWILSRPWLLCLRQKMIMWTMWCRNVRCRLFNERDNQPYRLIYGAVTDGFEWVFLRLENEMLYIDTDRYYLNALPDLLGALQTIIDFY